MRPTPALLAAALVAACAAPTPHPIVIGPRDHPGFPARSTDPVVWAEASFPLDHAARLGQDVTRRGYLPVMLRVGLGRQDGVHRRLEPGSFDAHLYLADGTPLPWVPPEEVAAGDERILESALHLANLRDWQETGEGVVFFRFTPPEVRVEGPYLLSSPAVLQGEFHRELEVPWSLLSFTVVTDDGPQRVSVGLGEERRAP